MWAEIRFHSTRVLCSVSLAHSPQRKQVIFCFWILRVWQEATPLFPQAQVKWHEPTFAALHFSQPVHPSAFRYFSGDVHVRFAPWVAEGSHIVLLWLLVRICFGLAALHKQNDQINRILSVCQTLQGFEKEIRRILSMESVHSNLFGWFHCRSKIQQSPATHGVSKSPRHKYWVCWQRWCCHWQQKVISPLCAVSWR